MGAAGLTSSSVEMADKGGVGIELDLDRVPCREQGMTAYEMMLSESQERMLMVLQPGSEARAETVFGKWGLDFAVIGRTTDTGRLLIRHRGRVEADLPVGSLADSAPEYERPWSLPEPPSMVPPGDVPAPESIADALETLMGSLHLCSRRWVWEQYDHMVMGDTVQRPGGDAAVVRVHGTRKGLAATADVTPRYCSADPVAGGGQAVVEAWRNLTAVGATPLAVTDCMNFGNPERDEVMGQFVGCIKGMARACEALDFPVVSGNVSLYNETNGIAIPPTPAIGGVGLIPDIEQMATIALKEDGHVLLLLGAESGHLGQSIYMLLEEGRLRGAPPPVDLDAERRAGVFVRTLIRERRAAAVHDVSDGGLLVAIAEMALSGGIGVSLAPPPDGPPAHATWFGEDQGRYVISVAKDKAAAILSAAGAAKIPARELGTVGGEAIVMEGERPVPLSALRELHEDRLPDYMTAR